MFLGEFQHSLDAKGRVILPAKFRDQLAGGAFVAKGRDGCLFVYTAEEFEQVAQQAREASRRGDDERQAARSFFAVRPTSFPTSREGSRSLNTFGTTRASTETLSSPASSPVSRSGTAAAGESATRLGEQALTTSENLPDFGI